MTYLCQILKVMHVYRITAQNDNKSEEKGCFDEGFDLSKKVYFIIYNARGK